MKGVVDGNRLQKSSGKIYWYGAGSEILDESDASGNITDEYVFFGGKRIAHRVISTGSIYYYMEDFLGSSRVITDSSGNVCYEADFYPFGGERVITNTCPQNYKFQGKERDTETGNDDFGARYYSSSTGRWLSPDWSAIPAPVPYANLANPQTLNLYAMVHDNPETFADLDGHIGPDDNDKVNANSSNVQENQQARTTDAEQRAAAQQLPQQTTQAYTFANTANDTIVAQSSTTAVSTDRNGTTTTTITVTSATYSTAKGHEGEFVGASQTTWTSTRSADGNIQNVSRQSTTLSQGDAARTIGSGTINSAIAQTVPNRTSLFAKEAGKDAKEHPGKYVAATGGVASILLGPAGYPVAAGVARAVGLAGALYDAITH